MQNSHEDQAGKSVEWLGYFQKQGVCTKQARIAETLDLRIFWGGGGGESLLREQGAHR